MVKRFPPAAAALLMTLATPLAADPLPPSSNAASDRGTEQVSAPASAGAPIAPFTARYGLTGSGLPITIRAERTLTRLDDGLWQMSIGASNLLGEIREASRFRWGPACRTETQQYSTLRKGFGRTREAELTVSGQQARSTRNGTPYRSFQVPAGVSDILAQTLTLQCLLQAEQRGPFHLDVANERRLETMDYRITGEDRIKIGDQRLRAIRVERIRADNERTTQLWFAPERHYALVRMIQQDGDDRFVLNLL